jgi:phosphotransferase system  glucose/maltose/N-acetylglucosamine-specific IIC component
MFDHKKLYIPFVCIAIGFAIGFFFSNVTGVRMGGSYNPKTVDIGVYFTTTSDHSFTDGYSGPFRVDQYGRLIVTSTP